MHVLITIFLAVLATFSSKVQLVSAQSVYADDTSDEVQAFEGEENDYDKKIRYQYEERLEKLMGLDIKEILEEYRSINDPTPEEKRSRLQARTQEKRLSSIRKSHFWRNFVPKEKIVPPEFRLPHGRLKGPFPLKDGNTAYSFFYKVWEGSLSLKPGVRDGIDILGQRVTSGGGENSPYAVRPGSGYEVQPQRLGSGKPRLVNCLTYLVADPSGKVFFWSHRGSWMGCREAYRNLR
jgi:hypothetical protein